MGSVPPCLGETAELGLAGTGGAGAGRRHILPGLVSTCCLSPVPPQKAYIFTFLLSSRLFIEPQELLARVCHMCIEQQQLDKPVLDKVRGRAGQRASERAVPPTTPRHAL